MSKENVRKFFEALKSDQALAEELQNSLKAANAETAEQAKAVVLQFAAQQNLAFTADALAEYEKGAHKLLDEELEQVNAAGPCDGALRLSYAGLQMNKPDI